MKRTLNSALVLRLVLIAGAVSCTNGSDDVAPTATTAATEEAEETPAPAPATTTTTTAVVVPPKPGALMLALDGAMGSIGFTGQSATALLDSAYEADWSTDAWQLAHCKPVGGAVLTAYQSDEPVRWGCLLAVKTDGPDTPRGGAGRIVSVSCAVDAAITAGKMTVDGLAHTFKMVIDEACWGAEFAAMAQEQMPQAINAATGLVEIDSTVTAYTTIPATWSADASKWSSAYDVLFSFGDGDATTYKMLLYNDDTTMAASILSTSTDSEKIETFAMSLKKLTGGTAEFRYEGRFPYGLNGDGSSVSSNHTRVLVSGPYAGGVFSAVTAGEGFEASMYGTGATTVISTGSIRTFKANADGLGTKNFDLTITGAVQSGYPPSEDWSGSTGTSPNVFEYAATTAEMATLLTTEVAAFSAGGAWHKANGPLAYTSCAISD